MRQPTVATRRAPKRGTSLRTWTDTTATVSGPTEIMSPATTMLSPHGPVSNSTLLSSIAPKPA